MKTCKGCLRVLRVEQFSPSKQTKDGLYAKCRDCVSSYRKRLAADRVREGGEVASKTCSRCSETKSCDQFTHNSVSVDRLSSWCKTCSRAVNRVNAKKRGEELLVLRQKVVHYQNVTERYRRLLVEAGIDLTKEAGEE